MPTFAPAFQPITPIGQAFQNIATAIMASKLGDGKADLNSAHQQAFAAQAANNQAEADQRRQDIRNRDNALPLAAGSIFGGMPQGKRFIEHWRNGPTTPVAPWGATDVPGDPETGMGGMSRINPTPDFVTPERERLWADTVRGIALANAGAGKSNALEIAKAITESGDQRQREAVVAGSADPTRIAQSNFAVSGKAPFDFRKEGTGNLATGRFDMNSIGTSETKANAALANQRNASAGQHSAQAAQIKDRTSNPQKYLSGGGSDKLVLTDDGEGNAVWTPSSQAAGVAAGFKPTTPAKAPSAASQQKDLEKIWEEFGQHLPNVRELDPSIRSTLTMRAADLVRNGVPLAQAVERTVAENPLGIEGGVTLPIIGNVGGKRVLGGSSASDVAAAITGGPAATPAAAQRASTPAQSTGGLPPQAASQLREGVVTTFGNGQKWQLQGGKPVRVQ